MKLRILVNEMRTVFALKNKLTAVYSLRSGKGFLNLISVIVLLLLWTNGLLAESQPPAPRDDVGCPNYSSYLFYAQTFADTFYARRWTTGARKKHPCLWGCFR